MKNRILAAANYARILSEYHAATGLLLGADTDATRRSLAEQIVDSVRRVDFVRVVRERGVSSVRADPDSGCFDPIRAAIYHNRIGDVDEAAWLVFLSTHFGKHGRSGWSLPLAVYRGGGAGERWTWARTSQRPEDFRAWLHDNQGRLRGIGAFGNHRKYVSLDAKKPVGTGAAVSSYVRWIKSAGDHRTKFTEVRQATTPFSEAMFFDRLYNSLGAVTSFGRMAKFDYLTMIGKTGILAIEPGKAYLTDATGPLNGARLLFGRNASAHTLEDYLVDLAALLGVGQQVMEDSICNWQKSPVRYRAFKG